MKVFKKEFGIIKSVFINKGDIRFLNNVDTPIPGSIYTRSFHKGIDIISNGNEFDYIEFTEQNEIDYFVSADFILDYEEYANLSLEDLENKSEEVSKQINEIAQEYNVLSDSEKIKNRKMYNRSEQLKFMIHSITELYRKKQNNEEFKLPKGIHISIVSKQTEEQNPVKKLINKFNKK